MSDRRSGGGRRWTKDLDLQAMTGPNGFPSWEPRELGLPRATLFAILLAAAITTFCVLVSSAFRQKPVPEAMRVTLTQLPQPAPPPTPQVTPLKPVPEVIPKPPPVPSHIAVATKPPSVRHISKPVPHPVIHHTPPSVRIPARMSKAPPRPPAPVRAAPPMAEAPAAAAPAAPTSGIPSYGEQIYAIIEANQNVPFALAQMGASGTAVIEIEVAPDGRVISARVYKSSGVPLIDATALDHARDAHLPPFNDEMPNQPHVFLVPIAIQPSTND
jgi:protein TonB